MTPGQARFTLITFLLIAGGVTVNAIFLQPKAGPAARATAAPAPARMPVGQRHVTSTQAEASGSREPAGLRITRFAPDASRIDPMPASPDSAAGADTVRAIQRELKLRGYGPLAGDGNLGLPTRAAIMAYEHDQGLALTGEASERLLRRILLGATDGTAGGSSSAGKSPSPDAQQVIRTVQQWLTSLGYQPGRAEGQLTDQTVQAIRDFEVDRGLVPRGRISADLVARLSEGTAPKPSRR